MSLKMFHRCCTVENLSLGSICQNEQGRQDVMFLFFMGMEVLKAFKLC